MPRRKKQVNHEDEAVLEPTSDNLDNKEETEVQDIDNEPEVGEDDSDNSDGVVEDNEDEEEENDSDGMITADYAYDTDNVQDGTPPPTAAPIDICISDEELEELTPVDEVEEKVKESDTSMTTHALAQETTTTNTHCACLH